MHGRINSCYLNTTLFSDNNLYHPWGDTVSQYKRNSQKQLSLKMHFCVLPRTHLTGKLDTLHVHIQQHEDKIYSKSLH